MRDQTLASGLPMGFGLALTQNPSAMKWFTSLSKSAQDAIIERTHTIRSKEEMRAFINQLEPKGTES